ncbi:hypothetical protein GCM10027449_26340 [Sinomonas notoginsengisoli]|uniref:hypothetical protein n=1 Tax=Sinomonas notoginsengisoli TaxID=1457311 RepID=UPI001F47BF7B|nr:hypothetical protein [Sinomonas notoginsengisoli]
MVQIALDDRYDLPRRISELERKVLILATQPVLKNASTGQEPGKPGLKFDEYGLHAYGAPGAEISTIGYRGDVTVTGIRGHDSPDLVGVIFGADGSYTLGDTVIGRGPYIATTAGPDGNTYIESGATGGGVQVNSHGTTGQVQLQGNTTVFGNHTVNGMKSFVMDHPTQPDMILKHAVTESPASGVEYLGRGHVRGRRHLHRHAPGLLRGPDQAHGPGRVALADRHRGGRGLVRRHRRRGVHCARARR